MTAAPVGRSFRPQVAAAALLLLGLALGLRAALPDEPTAAAPVAHAVRPLPLPVPVASAPVAEPVVVADHAASAPVLAPVVREPAPAQHPHRHHRPMFASADRSNYTLVVLPD